MYLEYYFVSNIGLRRKKNQDNILCSNYIMPLNHVNTLNIQRNIKEEKSIFGVFDGLGGEKDGEVASYIAAKTFLDKSDFKTGLNNICKEANAKICSYMDKNNIDYMGTTAAVLSVDDKEVNVLNIGDTKIYRLSDNIFSQISVDHIDDTIQFQKPSLYQYIGIRPSEMIIEPYMNKLDYKKNDIYLICSDGLSDMISKERIEKIIKTSEEEKAANLLLNEAIKNGGKDNITFILMYLR